MCAIRRRLLGPQPDLPDFNLAMRRGTLHPADSFLPQTRCADAVGHEHEQTLGRRALGCVGLGIDIEASGGTQNFRKNTRTGRRKHRCGRHDRKRPMIRFYAPDIAIDATLDPTESAHGFSVRGVRSAGTARVLCCRRLFPRVFPPAIPCDPYALLVPGLCATPVVSTLPT